MKVQWQVKHNRLLASSTLVAEGVFLKDSKRGAVFICALPRSILFRRDSTDGAVSISGFAPRSAARNT